MTTKTCMQPGFVQSGPRRGCRTMRRLPHETPEGARGYAECRHCGVTVYVGNELHAELQAIEGAAARADRQR